jgi:hypothetical protein
MQPNDSKVTVPKLQADGANWVVYCNHLFWTLEAQVLEAHLMEDTVPQDYAGMGTIAGVSTAVCWRWGEGVVKQLITSTIPDTVFNHIKHEMCAKDVWEALRKLYEECTMMIAVELVRCIRTKKCREMDNVRTHFDQLADLCEQLAMMGKEIDDIDYMDILLASLPPSYETTCMAINVSTCMSKQKLTPDIILQFITDEYEHHVTKDPDASMDEAFTSDAKRKKKSIICYNCNKCGHVKANCWAKGGSKEGQGLHHKAKSTEHAAMAAAAAHDIEAWLATEEWTDLSNLASSEWTDELEDDQSDESSQVAVIAASDTCREPTESELYDSGASRHMSPFQDCFSNYCDIEPCMICAADKHVFYAIRTGSLQINIPNGKSFTPVILKDTLHAPDIGLMIILIGCIVKARCTVSFGTDKCTIKNNAGHTIGIMPTNTKGLYRVDHGEAVGTAIEAVPLYTLHHHLGHISPNSIHSLIHSRAVTGVTLSDDSAPSICNSCKYVKNMCKVIVKEHSALQATSFGEEVHTDIWGPSPTQSLGSRKYYVTFKDDYSCYMCMQLLCTKDKAFRAYKAFAAWAKMQQGAQVKHLRSNHGGKFMSNKFDAFLKEQGTEQCLMTHDMPQHNGIAKSLNQHILECIHTLLHGSGLPKTLWGKATHLVVWVKNRTTTCVLGKVTPYERLYGEKPNLAGLPEWGQHVWVHQMKGSKLSARALKG